ncbi:AAA family ATPase [Elusimicrobiota bacterium]
MYLKKLEIFGFKSFADKTKLDFEPGITAVVGPNGCGKSNTADAVRWCLGEQKARSLRGAQMLDVIFGGSQARQTTGMAEVSLTFDNTQNVLPIDFSEVLITRRLFRSGESEYFINKSQCRLKDIRDMFLDTGIGSEGYSIIEQGKVEFLISARPDERREMFEEAAGVSKYKVRREETIRKLERTEIDMNRMNDMLTLLKEQITSLDIAAKKAKQFQKYKEDIKKYEIASMVQNILHGVTEAVNLDKSLDPKNKQYERINTETNQLDADISQLRLSHTEKDELYIKIQDEFSQIKSSISLADEKIRQASQREGEIKERKDILLSEIKLGEDQYKQYEKESLASKKMLEEIEKKVKLLNNDYQEKEKNLKALCTKLEVYKDTAKTSRLRFTQIDEEKNNLNKEIINIREGLVTCQTQLMSFTDTISSVEEALKPFRRQLAQKQKEISTIDNDLTKIRNNFNLNEKNIEELKVDIENNRNFEISTKENIAALESKKMTLQEWDQKDPIRSTIRAVKSLNIAGIKGPIISLIQIDPGMEASVSCALGEKINYMISDTVENAKTAIKYLESNNIGRISFVVEENIKPKSKSEYVGLPVGARSLMSVMQYDSQITNVLEFLFSDILIYGNSVYGNAIIQGGKEVDVDSANIEEQFRELNLNLEKSKSELSEISVSSTKLKSKMSEYERERDKIQKQNDEINIRKKLDEHQINELNERISLLEEEILNKKEIIKKKENEEKDFSLKLASIEKNISDLAGEESGLQEKLLVVEAESKNNHEEELKQNEIVNTAKVELVKYTSELESRLREEKRIQETFNSVSEQIEKDKKELEDSQVRISELKKIQDAESANLKEFNKQYSKKETEVQVSLSERQEIMQKLEEKNSKLHDLRQQLESIKQEIHDLEMEKRSFDTQRQTMEKRLSEEYSLNFTEVKDQYKDIEVDEDEMARIRRKIESLGNVNLAAPEEYENLEERYNFLSTQHQDLFKAKEDLHQVISKINQNTKENFKKTYEDVRNHFKGIYARLFEGGNADLLLTDEQNLLESGIEIIAQPPGKKLQSMSSLSGGEKALTAIALLFAFFMVRPSPFCILDEVDAPLDDANINRYVSMVKEFAKMSQFLVITHNKRTMEMADVLYGITMEEFGVSKLIAVKLNKEKAFAESVS